MIDQSFSEKNLFDIYRSENKKGNDIGSRYFSDVNGYYEKIKRVRKLILKHYSRKRWVSESWFKLRASNLYLILKIIKKNKDNYIRDRLLEVSKKISAKSFCLMVERRDETINGKYIYCLENRPEAFFAEKQIQKNIKKVYGVKQGNRDVIVPQVASVLSNNYPCYVIKADILSFYESVNTGLLLQKINRSKLLGLSSRKQVSKLLSSYRNESGSIKGIPRGVGVSSYLSELYMKDFDRKVNDIDGLVYYSRYVDDILIVVCPEHELEQGYYPKLLGGFLSEDDLSLNKTKTEVFYTPIDKQFEFDYLGYRFAKNSSGLSIGISSKKMNRYLSKLSYCIDKYNYSRIKSPVKAKKELKIRLKFLTSNTHLSNSKGNAAIGIYSSNKWVTDLAFLKHLDGKLQGEISRVADKSIQSKLRKKFSFEKGFKDKRYSNFRPKEFDIISEGWGL